MTYFEKNRQNILLITGGIVLLGAILLLAFRKKEYTSEDIIASVTPMSVKTGEKVTFEDKSPFGKTRKWVFGDGYTTDVKKGQHIFAKGGYYQVTLFIDNKLTKTFPVLVSSPVAEGPEVQVPTMIDAPSRAYQLETVAFRAITDNAKMFTWKFGETGRVDAKDKMATYSFRNPGTYEVLLFTDVDKEPIRHLITIDRAFPEETLEAPAPVAPVVTEAEVMSGISDDFRIHLQQIAYGNQFNYHYNYLLSKYLCNRDNASVSVNDKADTFYNYCMSLQFDKNNAIQEVKTTIDPGQNCVTKVEVKQSKQ